MEISVRQICFILIFYTAAAKLLQYPTYLSEYCGGDLVWASLISFAVQGAVIWTVAYLCSKTQKTFFGLVEDTFGKVAARIVYGFLAAYFIISALLPLFEQQLYVHAIFYDTVPRIFAFIPVFFFTVYAGSKSFKNIGRCADVAMPIFLFCIVPLVFMALSEADFSNLLPVFDRPFTKILGGAGKTAPYFNEPLWLLMFMGRFNYKKGDAAKITLSYALGAAIVLFFLALFYAVYGPLAPSRQFAVSKTSLYFSAMDMLGRIDLFILYALDVVMLFALVLNIQLSVQCLIKCTGYNSPEILSLCLNFALAAVLYIFNNKYTAIQNAFARWLWIAVIVFTVALPAASWALKRRKNG